MPLSPPGPCSLPALARWGEDILHTMTAFWKCDLSKPLAESFTFDLGGGGWGNDEAQNYTNSPENAFVKIEGEEDVLVVRAIARPDGKVTSARLVSRQTFERSKGYVSARITVPLSGEYRFGS